MSGEQDKFSRSLQTIRQFSARNKAEIAGRRRVLQGELASETSHLWMADGVTKIAWYEKLAEDLDGYLADPDLDLRVRHRYTLAVATLLHKAAELLGQLPTRSVAIESAPTLRSEIVGFDAERWQAEMMVKRGWVPPSDEDPRRSDNGDRATSSEPAPSPTPAPEPDRTAPAPAPERDGPITYGASADSGSSIFRSMSF